jgi:hypothetical protein
MKWKERAVVGVFMKMDILEYVELEAQILEIGFNELMILAIMKYGTKDQH